MEQSIGGPITCPNCGQAYNCIQDIHICHRSHCPTSNGETMTRKGNPVWNEVACRCGGKAVIGLMSLVSHCGSCQRVFVSSVYFRGWYESEQEALQAMEEK